MINSTLRLCDPINPVPTQSMDAQELADLEATLGTHDPEALFWKALKNKKLGAMRELMYVRRIQPDIITRCLHWDQQPQQPDLVEIMLQYCEKEGIEFSLPNAETPLPIIELFLKYGGMKYINKPVHRYDRQDLLEQAIVWHKPALVTKLVEAGVGRYQNLGARIEEIARITNSALNPATTRTALLDSNWTAMKEAISPSSIRLLEPCLADESTSPDALHADEVAFPFTIVQEFCRMGVLLKNGRLATFNSVSAKDFCTRLLREQPGFENASCVGITRYFVRNEWDYQAVKITNVLGEELDKAISTKIGYWCRLDEFEISYFNDVIPHYPTFFVDSQHGQQAWDMALEYAEQCKKDRYAGSNTIFVEQILTKAGVSNDFVTRLTPIDNAFARQAINQRVIDSTYGCYNLALQGIIAIALLRVLYTAFTSLSPFRKPGESSLISRVDRIKGRCQIAWEKSRLYLSALKSPRSKEVIPSIVFGIFLNAVVLMAPQVNSINAKFIQDNTFSIVIAISSIYSSVFTAIHLVRLHRANTEFIDDTNFGGITLSEIPPTLRSFDIQADILSYVDPQSIPPLYNARHQRRHQRPVQELAGQP